jgi:DNA primase
MELNKRSFAMSCWIWPSATRCRSNPRTRQTSGLTAQLTLREQLYEILAVTARFYEHALRQSDGAAALDYLRQPTGAV